MNGQSQLVTECQRLASPTKNVRPLRVRPALDRFQSRLSRFTMDSEAQREAVCRVLQAFNLCETLDSVGTFESILNQCLDLGFRGPPLMAFLFEVLETRLAARINRRLCRSSRGSDADTVSDLVGVTLEAIQNLLTKATRERHSVTYALLLSIADHRTIDFLRRKRPDLCDDLDSYHTTSAWAAEDTSEPQPERDLIRRERLRLARRLRKAILDSVNELDRQERAAMILVEVFGEGYDLISQRLGVKRTDVGNLVRRARLKRDRLLMPRLRAMGELSGHLGFQDFQSNRALRLNLLRWTTEMGDGVCETCALERSFLHSADEPCRHHRQAVSENTLASAVALSL